MNIPDTFVRTFVDRRLTRPTRPAASPEPMEHSLWKGLLAGAIAGVAATAAKTIAEKIYPPRTHGEPEPPAVLAEKVAGHHLPRTEKEVATETIHWTFGIGAGAAYGAIAEYYPAATGREGVSFGMTLMALTHESALPAIGLSAPPQEQTQREKTSELATHMVYGIVAEAVRRTVRKALQ